MIAPVPALKNGGMTSGAPQGTLGADALLQLLITQLKHQDPLDPLDSTQFLAQMAQFTMIGELDNLNRNMILTQRSTNTAWALSLIGQEVEANGSAFDYPGSGPVPLTYSLPQAARSATVEILNQQGQVVRTIQVGAQEAGVQSIEFDGKDQSGRLLPPGRYLYRVTAAGSDGRGLSGVTTSSGTVRGIEFSGDPLVLVLDGALVPLTSVIRVSAQAKG